MTRALVTGGAGFIGSHLVDRLLQDGFEVHAIDNLSVGREANLEQHRGNPHFRFSRVDIADGGDLAPYFSEMDWVFHLAARADVVPSIGDPSEYHRSNVTGTVAVLEAARRARVKRFVYSASSSCYGIPDQVPTPEEATISPMYPYALTKSIGESYVMHWAKVYKLPAVSLRFFNVYGLRARTSGTYGAVVGVFLSQIANGKPVTVNGDGTQSRDFTFVSDATDALLVAARSEITGEVFNVGSGGTFSVNALVELLGARDVVYLPNRPGEPQITFADTRKIERILKWQAKVSFNEGVALVRHAANQWQDAPLWEPQAISEVSRDWFRFLASDRSVLSQKGQ